MANFSLMISTLIFIINLISIFCQLEDEGISKVVACMAILNQKLGDEEYDGEIYSSMMLKCFISISTSQTKNILTGFETGNNKLSSKEIKNLIDINSLKKIPEAVLRKKTNELEKAMKDFKKLQEEFTREGGGDMDDQMDYDDDYDDESFPNEHPDKIHFLGLIPKGLKGIYNVFSNYISLFFMFILVYVSLLILRKINESEKKIKKKKNIVKKEEIEEIEENEEMEEDEEKEENINDKPEKEENGKKENISEKNIKDDGIVEENKKEIIKEINDINSNKEKIE